MDLREEFKGTIDEGMLELFEKPDEDFAPLAPFIKAKIKQGIESKEYQDQLLLLMDIYDAGSVEEEVYVLDNFINELKADNDLSPEKKDVLICLFECQKEAYQKLKECGRPKIRVKVTKLSDKAILPTYAHPTDAGCDIYAAETVTFKPGETKIVKTDLAVAIPPGYEIQIRPRSGMSYKTPMRIPNSPGTIDCEYRGNVGVIMENTNGIVYGEENEDGDRDIIFIDPTADPYTIHEGDKIAQMVLNEVPMIDWNEVETVDDLGATQRGKGGFGSTGQ